MMRGLSLAMLRKHVGAYVGCFAAMVLASALMGGALSMVTSALRLDGVDMTALDPEMRSTYATYSGLMAGMGGFLAFISTVVSVSLVASTIAFVVQGRRRELALLRLNGAQPRQVLGMVVGEVALLSLAAAIIGAIGAPFIGQAYFSLLGRTSQVPEGLHVVPAVLPLLGGVALTVGVAVFAALGPARRVGQVLPIEALGEGSSRIKPMTRARWVTGVGGLLGAVGLLLVPADIDPSAFVMAAILQGFLALVALVQLAPVFVGPVARFVCQLAGPFSPGGATLALGHASWNTARTASLANPALLLVAVPAILMINFFGLSHAQDLVMMRSIHIPVAVEQPGQGPAAPRDALEAVDGVTAATPLVVTDSDWWLQGEMPLSHQFLATDLRTLSTMVDVEVIAGDLDAVGGTRVAAHGAGMEVGSRHMFKGPAGDEVELEVVASLANLPVTREFIVDLATFDLQGGAALNRIWFLDTDRATPDDVRADVVAALGGDAAVMTTAEWSADLSARGNAQTMASTLILIGGATLLSTLAVGIAIMTSLRERRAEFALARRAGGSGRTLVAAALIETLAVLVVSAVLVGVVIVLAWVRLGQGFAALQLAELPAIPWTQLAAFALAGLLVAVAATLGGMAWSLRSIRMA